MERPLLVYTTFPDEDTALRVGEILVRDRLAACVNVLPGMRSIYAWQGAVEQAREIVAIVKTREGLRGAIGAALKAHHPYDTPSIIYMETRGAEAGTLTWLLGETGGVGTGGPA